MSLDVLGSFEQGTREFLKAWYTIELPTGQARPGREPEALRRWWHWQESSEVSFVHQNHLCSQVRQRGEFMVFYTENQGVVEWGYTTNPEGTDPEVFERQNHEQATWQQVNMGLSDFMLHIAAFEANVGAEDAVWLTDPTPLQVDELSVGLTEVSTTAIEGMRLYIGRDSILTLHHDTLAVHASRH